jgi:hypothetical protein
MSKYPAFYIILAIFWITITIVSGLMAIAGQQVDAYLVFMSSMVCTCMYIDKILDSILDKINKKEKEKNV